ncbi:hypothetical protein E2C01_054171 [Portunus trituberculatus]|uniref:Uncharacterized protein n=1 Tax=Portunus trituberculatus TaxID=210409 RepID=A0A5B7GUA7_PORTR|nr:hypothetical protein [Portunus trituberculatus]
MLHHYQQRNTTQPTDLRYLSPSAQLNAAESTPKCCSGGEAKRKRRKRMWSRREGGGSQGQGKGWVTGMQSIHPLSQHFATQDVNLTPDSATHTHIFHSSRNTPQ